MNLFQGEYIFLHSGEPTDFKIDCDALSDEDIKQLAKVIARKYEFSAVYGIPTGGERLAKALEAHITSQFEVENREGNHWRNTPGFDIPTLLIVDDVLTTGASFRSVLSLAKKQFNWKGNVQGICIFAREPKNKPDWVDSVFDMNIST